MKKLARLLTAVLVMSTFSLGFAGCYGQFTLTKKLYNWNGQLGNKWAKSAVMWILFIVPVYEIAGFIDFVILNVVEFWSGTNPVSMKAGEKETQLVELDGRVFRITATPNRFDIAEMDHNNVVREVALVYAPATEEWFVESKESGRVKIAEMDGSDRQFLSLIKPDGREIKVNLDDEQIWIE